MITTRDKRTGGGSPAPYYTSYDICLVQDCNLRCKYCSSGFGRWGGKSEIMSRETIDGVVSFIQETSSDEFTLSFSGGETLLSFHNLRYFIEKIFSVKKTLGKKVLIEVSTNGINLTQDIADYLAANRVTLSFSIDGDRITTNRNRIMPNGQGVYDHVRNAIDIYRKALIKNGFGKTRIKAECTIDEKANIFQSVLHLFNIGFNDVLARPAGESSFTGFHSGNSHSAFLSLFRKLVDYVLTPLKIEDIIIDNCSHMFLNIKTPLLYIVSGRMDILPCDIINKKICIMANGKITPCFLANGPSDLLVFGDIKSGVNTVKASNLLKDMKDLMSFCNSCFCRPLCKTCYLRLMKEGKGRSEYCRLQRESMAILADEVSKRYGLLPVLKNV